jgi:flavin reductase (DIM6/NTAB) family NADH-FMN oxidoreductase RutF
VSTINADGIANLAPHSYFNGVANEPPILLFVSTHSSRHDGQGRKDTLRNLQARGEFAVSIVSDDLLEAMNQTAAEVAPGVDEFALAGLEKAASVRIAPPRVARARAALECRLIQLLEMGDATVVFGEVLFAHVANDVWVGNRADVSALAPVGRLGGSLYARLGEVVSLRRPELK